MGTVTSFGAGLFFFFFKRFWGQNFAVMTAFLPVSEKADVPSEQG